MEKKLAKIAQQIKNCQKCSLYEKALNPVPGQGSGQSRIVFIGEAPGKQEDQQGIPFCGASGKILDQLLKDISLDRTKVFIGNILKHRPPNNRDPKENEIKQCLPYLKKQLNILQPQLIVTLGRYAMNIFLPNFSISQIHGQPKRVNWQLSPYFKDQEMYQGKIVILPLYHPAVVTYRREMMDVLATDFKKIPLVIKKIKQQENKK